MKKLFIILAAMCVLSGCGTLKVPTADIKKDVYTYSYVYIIPTSGVTSSSGVHSSQFGVHGGVTKTINPSEVISGYLMKKGFTMLPNVDPNVAENTLVVSYGYTGQRKVAMYTSASTVMIQFRDAKTHELVASCEGEGYGEDETDDILQAIYGALGAIFTPEQEKQKVNVFRSRRN